MKTVVETYKGFEIVMSLHNSGVADVYVCLTDGEMEFKTEVWSFNNRDEALKFGQSVVDNARDD